MEGSEVVKRNPSPKAGSEGTGRKRQAEAWRKELEEATPGGLHFLWEVAGLVIP